MLSIDDINRLEKDNIRYRQLLEWLLKQQYYILHKNIRKKIKEVLDA